MIIVFYANFRFNDEVHTPMLQVTIQIQGHIDEHWSEWFDGLTIAHIPGEQSILSGPIVDQSALYGLLARLWDYKLSLVFLLVQEQASPYPEERRKEYLHR